MNPLDVALLVVMGFALMGGYRLGFVRRAGSWLGLAAGLVVGARLAPVAVDALEGASSVVLLSATLGVVSGCALIGQALGMTVGSSLRSQVPTGGGRALDHLGGALAGVLGVLVVVWLLLPALGSVPGDLSRLARTSGVVGFVHDRAPTPPDSIETLRRIVGDQPFPEVFVGMRPAPVTGPPPGSLPLPEAVLDQVRASTVNVEAVACGRIQEGSGFTSVDGIVVTNAHVVAGASEVRVLDPTGARTAATVVHFDGARDLALLDVPGLGQRPLPLGGAEVGDEAAVFGHPGGQDQLRIAPAGIQERITAVGRDIHGDGQVSRQVFVLAAELAQGDSGAALVDPAGNVVGVAFAIAPDRPQTAYALTVDELEAALAAPRSASAGTGACIR